MTKIRRASSGPFEGALQFVDREFTDQPISPGQGFGFATPPQGSLRPSGAFATVLADGPSLDSRLIVSQIVVAPNGTVITYLTNVHSETLNPAGVKYRLTLVK